MIRVVIPQHLQTLAHIGRVIELQVGEPFTLGSVLDELEGRYPVLRGTIRDQVTLQRRPFIRFFACGQDWSHLPVDACLPDAVATGVEPFRIVGAMAGG
jgi:molybdopterin synthase sulfur carrier subunit